MIVTPDNNRENIWKYNAAGECLIAQQIFADSFGIVEKSIHATKKIIVSLGLGSFHNNKIITLAKLSQPIVIISLRETICPHNSSISEIIRIFSECINKKEMGDDCKKIEQLLEEDTKLLELAGKNKDTTDIKKYIIEHFSSQRIFPDSLKKIIAKTYSVNSSMMQEQLLTLLSMKVERERYVVTNESATQKRPDYLEKVCKSISSLENIIEKKSSNRNWVNNKLYLKK